MPTNPKPVLEVSPVPVFRVHQSKFEAYVKTVFGFDFDLLVAMGVTEGQCVELEVDGKLPTMEWEKRAYEIRTGRRSKNVVLIFAVLCHDGYIKRGRYIISTHPLPDPTKTYTELLRRTGNPQADECATFKRLYKSDKVFQERAAILDERFNERKAT